MLAEQAVDLLPRPLLFEAPKRVRERAMEVFGMLDPLVLSQHVDALLRALEDGRIQDGALNALWKLGPSGITQHLVVLRPLLTHEDEGVQNAVAQLLAHTASANKAYLLAKVNRLFKLLSEKQLTEVGCRDAIVDEIKRLLP